MAREDGDKIIFESGKEWEPDSSGVVGLSPDLREVGGETVARCNGLGRWVSSEMAGLPKWRKVVWFHR